MEGLPKGMRPEPAAPPAPAGTAVAELAALVAVAVQDALRRLELPLDVVQVAAQGREVTLTVAVRPEGPAGGP